jgi:hypothetical protein
MHRLNSVLALRVQACDISDRDLALISPISSISSPAPTSPRYRHDEFTGTQLPLASLLFRLRQKTTLLLRELRRTRVLFRALFFSFFPVRRNFLY